MKVGEFMVTLKNGDTHMFFSLNNVGDIKVSSSETRYFTWKIINGPVCLLAKTTKT